MTDPQEIAALQASLRGTLRTAESLAAQQPRLDALSPHAAIEASDLEELVRLAAAHAVAACAFRGLVETLLARRGAAAE